MSVRVLSITASDLLGSREETHRSDAHQESDGPDERRIAEDQGPPDHGNRPSGGLHGEYRHYQIAVLVLACFSFIASYVIYRIFFPLGTPDLDEGVYVFQAHMFLHGMASLPAHHYGEFFRPWLSGQRDGRIFTVYQPGMPAFIAGSLLIFGSAHIGIALLAALEIPAAYGFVLELLGERRIALTTCVFLALSPMFLLHSALVLSYLLSLLGVTAGGWALLRATRTHRARDVVLGGLFLGITVLTRPFDAVLFGLPVLVFVAYRMWGSGLARRLIAPLAIGLAPAVLATLWYNRMATGAPLDFPNNTADPLNTFGFGMRSIITGLPAFPYGVSEAYHALLANLHTVPSWLFGGFIMVCLAIFGVYSLRHQPADVVLLVVLSLAFPAGYFFWWATALSARGATNGLGPHYYIPSFLPLLALGAVGFTRLVQNRSWPITVTGIAVLIAVTAWAIPDKIGVNYGYTKQYERVHGAIPPGLTNALVFIHSTEPSSPYLAGSYPFLQTDPRLQGPIVYAGEPNILDFALIRQMSSRRPYVLTLEYEPGDSLFAPTGARLTPLHALSGRTLTVKLTSRKPIALDGTLARAYLIVGGQTHYASLQPTAKGTLPAVTWTLTVGRTAAGAPNPVTLSPGYRSLITVGIETSTSSTFSSPALTERRMLYETSSDELKVLAPGLGWELLQFPDGQTAWLPSDLTGRLAVQVAGH